MTLFWETHCMSCALSLKNEVVKPLIFGCGFFFSFMQLKLELEVRRRTHFSSKCFQSVL